MRKKSGWKLLAVYLTYSIASSLIMIFVQLTSKPSSIHIPDDLFPVATPVTIIFTLFFFCGSLLLICKEGVREIYAIDKKVMQRIIGLSVLGTVVLFNAI